VASRAPDPLVLLMQGFSSGHADGLGRFGAVTRQSLRLDTLVVTGGSLTLTTAHGDTLAGTYEGCASFADEPGVVVYDACVLVSAGTGRLAGATGTLALSARADLTTGDLSETVAGWLVPGDPARDVFARPLRTSRRLRHGEGIDHWREER
jgi:hypothetical protein